MKLAVQAYHLIITTYGFWLPNDPRGSWSDFVRDWELYWFGGPATKVASRRSHAHDEHERAKRLGAKDHLARDPVSFTGEQARAVARGFADYSRRSGLVIYACASMPEHMHLVTMRHTSKIEQVANLLKGVATTQLIKDGLHPFVNQPYRNGTLPSPWARKQWACYLTFPEQVMAAIEYTNANPEKEGKPRQQWSFVQKYVS
jgi:REP element-mobilizing transposase RayT